MNYKIITNPQQTCVGGNCAFCGIARNAFGLPNTLATLASLGETPNTPIGEKIIIHGGKIIENKTTNRTRPYAYTFRASAEEKELIDSKIKASGLTMTEFIIRAIKNKPITVINSGGEILAELKRQGNNLNQAVRNCYFHPSESAAVIKAANACKEVYKILFTALGG